MYFDALTHVTMDGKWFHTLYDASLERLINESNKAKITKALLVGIAGIIPNDYILHVANEHPDLFIPIAGFNPVAFKDIRSIAHALKAISTKGFKGIKLHPRFGGRYHLLQKEIKWTICCAAKYNLTVLICTMLSFPAPPLELPVWKVVDELCGIEPNAKIIFVHGGYNDFLAVSEVVGKYQRVILDLSLTFLKFKEKSKDEFEYVFNKFDNNTVIGSDFPEYTFSEVLEEFNKLNIAESKRKNILFENLYGLFNG